MDTKYLLHNSEKSEHLEILRVNGGVLFRLPGKSGTY